MARRRKSRRRYRNARRGFMRLNRHRSYNRRRHRRSRRTRSFNRRRRHRNPGNGSALSIRRPLGALTAGYKPSTLMKAVPVVGGALGNAWLSGFVSGFLPSSFRGGLMHSAVGLGTAGLLGAGVGMAAPGYAAPVFFGGVLQVLTGLANQYIVPMLPGMHGMGDYLTVADAAQARPLGDYLTVSDAAMARPLGEFGQIDSDAYIGEELASL